PLDSQRGRGCALALACDHVEQGCWRHDWGCVVLDSLGALARRCLSNNAHFAGGLPIRNASQTEGAVLAYLRRDSGAEKSSKIGGSLLRRAVEEALSKLRELAADLRVDITIAWPSLSARETLAPPLAKPATPPSPSPE